MYRGSLLKCSLQVLAMHESSKPAPTLKNDKNRNRCMQYEYKQDKGKCRHSSEPISTLQFPYQPEQTQHERADPRYQSDKQHHH